jgi:PhnB protein
MANLNIPEGYQVVMPYLLIPDAGKFMDFTKQVFGATEKHMVMREERIIVHGEIEIGGSMIMFADCLDQPAMRGSLFVYVADADASYQRSLDNGATSVMPLSDQPYGRTCGITDPCGNTWWITTHK